MRRFLLLLILGIALPAAAETPKKERAVNLDVKDAEVRVILKSVQKQCGIRNLVVDPDVEGKGTFYFREVPCRTALPVVLRTMGLTSVTYSNSLVQVEPLP